MFIKDDTALQLAYLVLLQYSQNSLHCPTLIAEVAEDRRTTVL
jgi:hypothetical protein